jgi:imidazolonepropionase-like amidohydrolase
VASIEHGFPLSDALLERMKAKGVVLVGTDFTPEMAGWIGIGGAYPAIVDRLRRARRIGVPMAYGSDAYMASPDARTRGQLALGPLRTLQDAGITPREILRLLTTDAARLLGVHGERGRLQPGLAADLVATRKNPLDDPRALEDVVFVMKDGRVVVDRTGAARR